MKGEKNPESLIQHSISSGKAYEIFEKMIKTHKGDLKTSFINNIPKYEYIFNSKKEGYLNKIDTEKLGYILLEIGGGRKKQNDILDPTCGFEIYKKLGDKVQKNEPLIKFFCSNKYKIKIIKKMEDKIITINNKLGKIPPMIYN